MQGYAEEGFECKDCGWWISSEEIEDREFCPHCGATLRFQKVTNKEGVLILELVPPQPQFNFRSD